MEGGNAAASSRIHDTVARLTEQVTATSRRRMPSGGTNPYRGNPDRVELALMRAGEQKVARDYVIYREAQAVKRKSASGSSDIAQPRASASPAPMASSSRWTWSRLQTIITEACEGGRKSTVRSSSVKP